MRKRYLHDSYGEKDIFWDKSWDRGWTKKMSNEPLVSKELVFHIKTYLKPGMLLLEGGCGDGSYVRYFTSHGIKTIGIDFAQSTVEKLNKFKPELDVRLGDICNLNFPANYFDAYYSGGVIEHFENGVNQQLTEAHRVIKKGGYFFVTVPHMNLIRKYESVLRTRQTKTDLDGRKSHHKEGINKFSVEQPPSGFHFHEYVFHTKEIQKFLINNGFMIIKTVGFSVAYGLCDIEFYRHLIGVDQKTRTTLNKFFTIPLRCAKTVDNAEFFCNSILSKFLGEAFGNLKLYICKVKK